MRERLQKILSARGVASRRKAEQMIQNGTVTVNGVTAALGDSADPELDRICVNGQPLPTGQRFVYILLNKPRGYVTTLSDEKGRPTVAELVKDCGVRVFPVGRLDLDSEGLLLLTNDGEWMQRILHPKYEVNKTYHVTVAGEVGDAAKKLSRLTQIDGEAIRPAHVEILYRGRETAELAFTIHEGKNRQIRRMCAAVGLCVKRLRRVAEHDLLLGDLPIGAWRDLTERELSLLQ